MLLHYWMKRHWKNQWFIKKINQKEAEQLKQIFNYYIDKREEIMKNTSFKVEDVFGDVISKDSISPEQIGKLNIFLAKILWILL